MKIIGLAHIYLTKKFEELGRKIFMYNLWYLIIPILLTIALTPGILLIKIGVSEDQFIPAGGATDKHKSRLISMYPLNISNEFDPGRLLELSFYGTVTIQATDKGSVLRQSVFTDLIHLDQIIRNFTINDENALSYEEICATNEGKCYENKILLLKSHIGKIENRTLLLKYPVEENYEDRGVLSLGGVIVDKNDYIISAQAITLFYFLDNTDVWKEDIARKWEILFIEKINEMEFKNIMIDKDISISREQSGFDLVFLSMKYIPHSVALMILFTIISCLAPDFLRSKPWLGIVSATATGMSLGSGFGLLSYFGVIMTSSATIVPFLVLGIGMDDSFIMLSAWMKTDPKKSLEDRISETYKECGVSISITSFTNIGSFVAGYFFSTLPTLKTFCVFMAICLIFDYIYQITFIGAVLLIFGRAEERRLHSIVFLPIKDKSSVGREQLFRKIFCYVQPDSSNETDKKPSFSVLAFWMKFSKWMTKKSIKILIIIIYFTYLSITIWGLTKYFLDATLNTGFIEGTYRDSYYKLQEKYYHQYQYRLQLFIDEELDYADPQVQENLEEMIEHLESDPLIGHSKLTEWWLRGYLKFLSNVRFIFVLSGFNLTDTSDFIYILRNYFLEIPFAKQFRHDIVFDTNYTSIVSSRFFLQTNITLDGNHFYSQLTSFREKLATTPYPIILYHPLFYYFDIIDLIPSICKQTFSIVIVTVFVICAILLPSVLTIVCVLINIFSVSGGIMSFMFFWGIGLNGYSVTVFIMVIGFCVDYAAHVSYAYDSEKGIDPNKRLISAVTLTAMPILQGASTTILAIIVCVLVPSEDVIKSIKIIYLSCVISAIHGILFLPVILSLFDSFSQRIFSCKTCSEYNVIELNIEENGRRRKEEENIAMNKI